MPNRIAVSSAEFIRNIGYWQAEALREPISITHHGRERLVLAPPDALGVHADSNQEAFATGVADHAAVLENLEEGYIAVDAQLAITASNIAAETFIGRAGEQLVGKSIIAAMPNPLGSIVADRLQRVMRSRKRETFDSSSFDGRNIQVRVFPCSIGAAILFQNTTEQHVLRRRLEQAEAVDAAVRRHPHAAALRLDGRARIEMIDETFAVWSGFRSADLIGHRVIDLISVPQRRDSGDLIERVLREGAPRHMALTLLGKQGQEMDGVLALAPILTDMVAHGAEAIWVPREVAYESQRVA